MVEPVRSGGRPRTNGWDSSTSPACASKLSTADSPENHSTTTAVSTSSLPVAKRLSTQRLRLRPPTLADAESLYELFADPQVMHGLNRRPISAIDEARAMIEAGADSWEA